MLRYALKALVYYGEIEAPFPAHSEMQDPYEDNED